MLTSHPLLSFRFIPSALDKISCATNNQLTHTSAACTRPLYTEAANLLLRRPNPPSGPSHPSGPNLARALILLRVHPSRAKVAGRRLQAVVVFATVTTRIVLSLN